MAFMIGIPEQKNAINLSIVEGVGYITLNEAKQESIPCEKRKVENVKDPSDLVKKKCTLLQSFRRLPSTPS